MSESIGSRITSYGRRRNLGLSLALLTALIALVAIPGPAGARVRHKNGTYKGSTTQQAVNAGFRTLQFKVTKSRVTLLAEPVVQSGLCVSTPVFTIDGNPSKKLSGRGAFTLTHTFIGNKFDKIHGRFVSPTEIQGYAIYHFNAQDGLCPGGKVKVNLSAKHG